MSLALRAMSVLAGRKRLSAGLSGSSATAANTGSGPFTTNSLTAQPAGGVGPYAYLWQYVSGDATFSATAGTSATTAFSASGSPPQTKNAVWRCRVTDAAGVIVFTANVSLSIQFQEVPPDPLSASLDPTSASAGGEGSGPFQTGRITVSVSGGVAPYGYEWQRLSGDGAIVPENGGISNPYFQASGTAPETKSGTWRCKVTDNVGAVAYTQNVDLTFDFTSSAPPALEVSVDTAGVFGTLTTVGEAETTPVTATPSGGVAPYSYQWERVSGDLSTSAATPFAATTTFRRVGSPIHEYSSGWRCKVTDNVGTVAYSAEVGATIVFEF